MAPLLFETRNRSASRGSRGYRQDLVASLLRVDLVLIMTACVLTVIGLVVVYSATRNLLPAEPSYYIKRQVIFAVTGLIVMVVCFVVDYRHLETWGYPLYAAAILALLAVRAVGRASGYGDAAGSAGAVREIKLGPFAIQPSEFVVLAMMFAVGVYAHRHEGRLSSLDVVKLLLLGGLPMVLVLAQPDLGTTIILAVVLFTMLVVAGVPLRYLAVISIAAVLAFFGSLHLHLLQGYQLQRITGFLNQNCNLPQNYNLCLSKTAIGAGGFRGVGLFHGVFTNNQYVPVQYADFIFSAIGEQFGFVGSALVLGLYALVALRMFRAIHLARDPLGRLICGGSLAFLVFSVFQNVGMTMGLVPITGIPLPFISYGGSALFAFFAAVGLVANVEYRRRLVDEARAEDRPENDAVTTMGAK